MDRQRRAIDDTVKRLWDNPCDYTDSNSKPAEAPNTKELASNLVKQAESAFARASSYKDVFADKLHSYKEFDALVSSWETYEWLREFPWYREEVLPKKEKITDKYLNELMKKIDDVLPVMYKGLKMIVASLYTFTKEGLDDYVVNDQLIKPNITATMHDARAVLCYFSDILKARNLETMPLADSEIPIFKKDNLNLGLFVYRDTLDYLKYLAKVFKKFYETDSV